MRTYRHEQTESENKDGKESSEESNTACLPLRRTLLSSDIRRHLLSMSQFGEDIPRDIELAEWGPCTEQLLDLDSRTTASSSHYEHPSIDDNSDVLPTPRIQAPQAPQGDFTPSCSSEALFGMYLDRALEKDKKMVEGWKSNTDGILVFVRLQVASLTSMYN